MPQNMITDVSSSSYCFNMYYAPSFTAPTFTNFDQIFLSSDAFIAPILLHEVECGEDILRFKKPLVFDIKKIYFDGELAYSAINKDLFIDIYDDSLDNLRFAIEDNICFLWETYALQDDDKLTSRAQKIKKAYLENVIGNL